MEGSRFRAEVVEGEGGALDPQFLDPIFRNLFPFNNLFSEALGPDELDLNPGSACLVLDT